MLTSRMELINKLEPICKATAIDKDLVYALSNEVYNKHNSPTRIITGIISCKIPLDTLSDTVLFFLSEVLIPDKIDTYFTKKEIKIYSSTIYEDPNKITFPYTLKMCQVADDQWIGRTDAKFFIGMNDYIKYNTKTQRVMTKIKNKSGEDTWKPTVNTRAVKEIQECYVKHHFISNTITLNFTDTSQLEYEYDEEKGEFTIFSLHHFDITDGYHRYLAMNNVYAHDEDFNLPMEIRITNFDEAKAQHWIYQEDKKTKMKKVDSESLNQNSMSNQVVERLNSFGSCLQGKISRNEGIISYGELAHQINRYYFSKEKMKEFKDDMGYKSKVVTDLKGKFGLLNDLYPEFLNEEVDRALICVLIREFSREADFENLERKMSKIIENKGSIITLMKSYKNKESKLFFEDVDNLIKEAQ